MVLAILSLLRQEAAAARHDRASDYPTIHAPTGAKKSASKHAEPKRTGPKKSESRKAGHGRGAIKPSDREAPADPADALKGLEAGISQSKRRRLALLQQQQQVQHEIAVLRDKSVVIARSAQENEEALAALQADYKALTIQAAEAKAALAERQIGEGSLLGALQRVAILPPEALVFLPGSPVEAERSAILLGSIVPVLKGQADTIAKTIGQLQRLQDEMTVRRREITTKQAYLDQERLKLDAIVSERRKLDSSTRIAAAAEQEHLTALSARATDLRDLIRKIEAERKAQLESEERARQAALQIKEKHGRAVRQAVILPPTSAPAIHLMQPVAGRVVKGFGEGDDFSTTKGLSLQSPPGATVVAPLSGRVMFAGPFRGYGQILIIDHGGGYHSLLAGLSRIQSAVGQSVVAGEPVGTMSTGESQTLYLELRWQGQPIDPQPSLSKRD